MTTVIHGQAADDVCLSRATFLLFDNYQKDPGAFQPETQAEIAAIARHWEQRTGSSLGVEKPSGFYATFYAPKDGNECPPTLVLRGTVFSDARGVALALRITVAPTAFPDRARSWSYAIEPAEIDIQRLLASTADGTQWSDRDEIYATLNIRPIEQITAGGGWLELFANRGLDTYIQRNVPIVPSFSPISGVSELTEDLRSVQITAQLELWLNQNQGDWATNVLQGIGEETLQYNDELPAAVEEALEIAQNEFDGKLRIVGHSLGGGLASAGAIYAKSIAPDMDIYGLTYDSSGVHRNTAESLRTSLDLASDAKIIARSVEDEILTSLQKRSDFVPLVSSAIRYTGNAMPPAIGTLVEWKGISPGPIGNKRQPDGTIINGHTFAPKWARMPNLLPIEAQDLVPDSNGGDPLDSFTLLSQMAGSAGSMAIFVDKIHAEIDRRVEETRAARDQSEAREEQRERDSELADDQRAAAEERAEAASAASEERAEAEAEAAAAAAEAEAEANEPTGFVGVLYDAYDESRDIVRAGGDLVGEGLDEISDAGRAVADEIGDAGEQIADELGDAVDWAEDAVGDAGAYVYERTLQYMEHWADFGEELLRVSDLLCMSKLAHASKLKEHDNDDDFQGSFRRAA